MKYLKRFKKILALAASAAMLTFLPNANVLTVSAAGPVTYYFMYVEGENESCWRYQVRSTWDADQWSAPIQDLPEHINNGDIVIIGNGSNTPLIINVHLSSLTFSNTKDALAVVSVANGIDNCYFNNNSAGAVSGAVTNAYIHGGDTLANFGNDVQNLYSYQNERETGPTIGVSGTVSYFLGEEYDGTRGDYGTNFNTDSFRMVNGDLTTASDKYIQDISNGPAASSAQPASTTTQSTTPAASNEYDAVPKTGETSYVLWLCLTAAVSLGGSLYLRKSVK